jgi:hypothetical protein
MLASCPVVSADPLKTPHHHLRVRPSLSSRLSSASCPQRRGANYSIHLLSRSRSRDCLRCGEQFHLREIASLDSVGIRSHACPRCHADLTESIGAHLYGCALLPAEVRSRAQVVRDTARILMKRSLELRDAADVAKREAEAALYALRSTMRQSTWRVANRRRNITVRSRPGPTTTQKL